MKIQRFVGSTHHAAMRQVRLALGPDALIVSSRRSGEGVEILAAEADVMDDEGRLAGVQDAVLADAAATAQTVQERVIAAPSQPEAPLEQAGGVMAAIDSLRGMLETRIDSMAWDVNLRRAPASVALFQTLLAAGFSTALLRPLLARLPDSLDAAAALAWARNELLTSLPVLRHEDDLLGAGGVFALVGPTGVGKTTTLAKLAARCVLRVGPDRVAMLTTDSYRIGAYEQLQIYGRLMRVPVRCARDQAELRQALAELGERDLILIDNVGISQRDRHVTEQAAMLCAAGRPVRRLLVLNAASHGDTLDEVARAYRGDDGQALDGCIITKLDEATRLGAALDTAIRYDLPVHYVSQGQKVPEDLSLASRSVLIDRALAQADEGSTLYAPNEADLSAMWTGTQADMAQRGADAGADTPQRLVKKQRRRELLLSALAGGGAMVGTDTLDQAVSWLQSDCAIALARDVAVPEVSADAVLARLTETAREAFALHCQSHLLAVHGAALVKGAGALADSRLASTLLMSDRGQAIAAPCQQLLTSQITISAWPTQDVEGALSATLALRARVARLADDYPQLPVVHVLDGGTPRLWQQLSNQGAVWLARLSGAARVVLDDGATTAQALARTLLHAPLQDGPACAVWAAETPIRSAVRQEGVYRLVSVRLIDGATGAMLTRLYGLSNLAADAVSTARLASWLVQQNVAKSAFRLMAHAWPVASFQGDAADVRKQILVAGQLGLACWQTASAPSAQAVRQLLAELAGSGASRRVSASATPGALLRLFALLEMAE